MRLFQHMVSMVSRYVTAISVLVAHAEADQIRLVAGHLSDPELVAFLKRAHSALRPSNTENSASRSVMVVKENVCEDLPGNQPQSILDEEDSSLTR